MRDYAEWRRGRREYAVWVIALTDPEILKKVNAAQEHLSSFLVRPYQRQPHVTLFVCGFLADTPRSDDDYGSEQQMAQMQLLDNARIDSFPLEIGALNSFSSAPFLEVIDREGGILKIRALLSTAVKEIRFSDFMPHITVGLYSRAFLSKTVVNAISTFFYKPIMVKVEQIMFATYKADVIAGPLIHKYAVSLRGRQSDSGD